MEISFNDLLWHDAKIKSLHIDRSAPGKKDEIKLLIHWPDDQRSELIFYDCYQFIAIMNFAIIAEETILDANCIEVSDKIDEIKTMWNASGANLEDLKEYVIETNSTNSRLVVLSLGFYLNNL